MLLCKQLETEKQVLELAYKLLLRPLFKSRLLKAFHSVQKPEGPVSLVSRAAKTQIQLKGFSYKRHMDEWVRSDFG